MNLWTDLNHLSKEEFREALKDLSSPKSRSRKKATKLKPGGPADDHPVSRIAYQIRKVIDGTDQVAMSKLKAALTRAGVEERRIPAHAGVDLETWLQELTEQVSDAVVMTHAKKLRD